MKPLTPCPRTNCGYHVPCVLHDPDANPNPATLVKEYDPELARILDEEAEIELAARQQRPAPAVGPSDVTYRVTIIHEVTFPSTGDSIHNLVEAGRRISEGTMVEAVTEMVRP